MICSSFETTHYAT